jgi:hypothetical protein
MHLEVLVGAVAKELRMARPEVGELETSGQAKAYPLDDYRADTLC